MAVKKGIFFTVDSLMASGIVILAILLISTFYISEHKKANVGYASQDLVRVFSIMRVNEVNNAYVKSLIESGEITNGNNTIIEQIGDFWSQDKMDLAKWLTSNLTEELIPPQYGFSLSIDGQNIYSKDIQLGSALVSSRKLVSGITKAQPTEGFTARVLLQGIKSKRTNAYVYFGGYEGDGNLTKKLNLPNDVISFESAYLEVDAGGNFSLYINGFKSGDYIKGSAGGGELLADKWDLTGTILTFFKAGENVITINFTSGGSYFAGGFLRVTYTTSSLNDTPLYGYEKQYFPGIDGSINLYSSIYFPAIPNNVSIFLHFLSPYKAYLNLGNLTIYETAPSLSEQFITINNTNISKRLDYALLNQETIPLRVGLMSISDLGQGGKVDAALVTDRTSSMATCDVPTSDCAAATCDKNPVGGCRDRRDYASLKADKRFINTVLASPDNSVASVGFGQSLFPHCDFHDLSNDNQSLIYWVSNYTNSWCGSTCIACGIYEATVLLNEKKSLYGLNELSTINRSVISLGSGSHISSSVNLSLQIDPNKFIKSRLSIMGTSVTSAKKDCIFVNKKFVGKMCDSVPNWHSCFYPLKPEWLNATGSNNITITGGDDNGCFGTAANDVWTFQNVKLIAWQTNSLQPGIFYNFTNKSDFINKDTKMLNMSINVQSSTIKSALLEFEAINITPSLRNCIFVNGNYVNRIDYQAWNGTNTWQKVLFDIPAIWLKQGINEINFTYGGNSFCYTTSLGGWAYRNVNLSVVYSDETLPFDRSQSMVIMSDGGANSRMGDCQGCTAKNETIVKACKAHEQYGINIYTVNFGGDSSGISTLNETACCDDCTHFYVASSTESLIDAFENIADNIAQIGYQYQSINTTSNLLRSRLFEDSYIDFNYTPSYNFTFNSIPIAFETDRFNNNISSGILNIYPNTTFSEGKVTSYSGSKWTDRLYINNTRIFNLSEYGENYLLLGDPFYVNIPAASISQGYYNITIVTGLNDSNPTNGSKDNRIIYSLLLNAFTDYSPVVAESDGCSWTVEFRDGTTSVIKVPQDYSGTDVCSYTSLLKKYSSNDSVEIVVYKLLSNLDIDKDGKLDVNIDSSNLEVNTLSISKVPSLWGPAVIEISVWE